MPIEKKIQLNELVLTIRVQAMLTKCNEIIAESDRILGRTFEEYEMSRPEARIASYENFLS